MGDVPVNEVIELSDKIVGNLIQTKSLEFYQYIPQLKSKLYPKLSTVRIF